MRAQAELKGPPIRICIPEESWPEERFNDPKNRSGPKYRRPCVRLWRALYGHPDSGTFWEQHCDKALKSVGFVALEDVPSAYYHKGLKILLTVYVDDFKMAGPTENL